MKNRSQPKHIANPINEYAGQRMRLRRENLNYSQQYTARKLGLTFQQIQKYEQGINRISASRLYDISKVLKTNVEYFFENMPEDIFKTSRFIEQLSNEEYQNVYDTISQNIFTSNETLNLINAYYKITNRALAKQLKDLIVDFSNITDNNTKNNI